jgi:two-component system OmpR family sensor kinase
MDLRNDVLDMSPGKIVLVYVAFGGIWILLSDQVVASLTNGSPATTAFQTIKGGVFVLSSGLLVFVLLRYRESQLQRSERKQELKSQESRVLQRILRHNIRNDLNVIRGNIELVDEDVTDPKDAERLEQAKETADDLLTISEKVRSLERIDLDESVPEPVDVVNIVGQATDQVRQNYPEVTLDIDAPETCTVYAGPSLRYAIDELLLNAVEHYDGPRDELVVAISIVERDDEVSIETRDNGPGIPHDEIEPIEAGDETALQHGSGIGLWVVQWVCDRYDGSVSFGEQSHDGAFVTIGLDKAPPA